MARLKDFYKAYGTDIKASLTKDERFAKILKNSAKFNITFFDNSNLSHKLLNMKLPNYDENSQKTIIEILKWLENTQNLAELSKD